LIYNEVFNDVYFGLNIDNSSIPRDIFNPSWWYRTEFELTAEKHVGHLITLKGINYKADVWLNGQ